MIAGLPGARRIPTAGSARRPLQIAQSGSPVDPSIRGAIAPNLFTKPLPTVAVLLPGVTIMSMSHALRSLKGTPVFTIAVILTLVLGVASVGSMFAIVHGVLLAPLPYGDPDRLVSVGLEAAKLQRMKQPSAVYFMYERFAQHLDDVGFHRTGNANLWTEGGSDAAERVTATWVTASMMPLLRVPPLLGRSFTAEEELPGGAGAVILSESEWRTRFDAATDVIGKTLMVNSVPREIVGVMPARFAFPTAETRLWLPVRLSADAIVGDFSYAGVARLSRGATRDQAQRELAAILPRMAESFPRLASGGSTVAWLDEMRPTPVVLPLREEITGGIARTLWMLAAAAGLLLLVAWANVANLMLIRADARHPELVVREALGASRLRTATHFLGESLLLGLASGVLALLATCGAVRLLVALGPAEVPRLAEVGVGLPTVGFIALVTAMGVVVCAAAPTVRILRASHSIHLRNGAHGESAGKSRQRLRTTIAALQVALALVVSLGAALLLRTAHRLYDVHPGFDASDATIIWTQLPFARYGDSASVAFYARLTELAGQIPSVRATGLTTRVPLGIGETLEQTFRVEGEGRTLSLPVNVVDDGYFTAMRIPLIAGRGFQRIEHERGGDIVISQLAAAMIFGDPDGVAAVGRRVTLDPSGPTYTVIGVVGDVRYQDLATAPSAMLYRPQVVPVDPIVEPGARRAMALIVRSSGPASAVVPEIRRIVRDLDPTVPLFNIETMASVIRGSTARLSLTLALMTVAAAITLLLGAIGLYSVMAYRVALRSREFAVRVALGAEPSRIARSVVGRGLLLSAFGIAAGFVLYAMAVPFLRTFLYGVTATDPATLGGATLVLLGTASLATWLPARRAARVDPAQVLRAE